MFSERIFCRDTTAGSQQKIHIDSALGRYKSSQFINVVQEWIDTFEGKSVLKTDLREEAFGEDEILFLCLKIMQIFLQLILRIS